MKTKIRHVAQLFVLIVAVLFIITLLVCDTRAQLTNSSQQLDTLMKGRQELSNRAVEETVRRRFEDKKSETTFPSDGAKSTKPGVLPALTPEERKALQHIERGLELFSKGKLDPAIKEYNEALRWNPKLSMAYNNLGAAYFSAGRFEEAAAAFRQAAALDPTSGQAFFNLALVELKLGHEKEVISALDAALYAYNSEGEAHFLAGRLKDAEAAFRGMLQIDPDYVPALLRLGLVYNAADRYEDSVRELTRVVARQPRNYLAYVLLAEAFHGEHKDEDAAASAERALKLFPNSPDAHYIAGAARAALGQRDAAMAHVTELRRLNATVLAQRLTDVIDTKAAK
jgi:tetratricopeptide (TPR) repeat protein